MQQETSEPTSIVSPDIAKIINDGQRLITFIAKDGDTELDPDVTRIIIDAKYKMSNNQWSAEDEEVFLINYDKLAKIVYPVTVESLHSIIPIYKGKKRLTTRAESAVTSYRRYTMFALILLLIGQVYWLCGHELQGNLINIMADRETLRTNLEDMEIDSADRHGQLMKIELVNQKLDANYKLLVLWNKAWSFGLEFSDTMPRYLQAEYESKKNRYDLDRNQNTTALQELELAKTLHQVRMVLFENTLSANFILTTFQGYILPLLYGLLGALIFVLRSLMNEVKTMTYTPNSEIKFRLRLTLGALGGMIVGWFLKPDEANAIASLSPMGLAFLMGYNVDLLFSIMDKAIDNIRKSIEAPAKR
ncbi:hypothetical protein A9Q99_22550 [Gammaproteobacteria bacterium 45_16_T64]|nr:hypothetical protein A9Q99_22550 [Gammaproteobacteria bacterium 45_16_T64]